MPPRRSGNRGARRWLLALVALYALVLLVTPLLHHDLACHLKSPTHCNACTANPLAPRVVVGIGLPEARLPEAEPVATPDVSACLTVDTSSASGRSPPG